MPELHLRLPSANYTLLGQVGQAASSHRHTHTLHPEEARAGQSGWSSHTLRGPRLHPRDNTLKQHVHYYQDSDQRRPGMPPCYLWLLSRLGPARALTTPRPLVHPEPRYAPAPPLRKQASSCTRQPRCTTTSFDIPNDTHTYPDFRTISSLVVHPSRTQTVIPCVPHSVLASGPVLAEFLPTLLRSVAPGRSAGREPSPLHTGGPNRRFVSPP